VSGGRPCSQPRRRSHRSLSTVSRVDPRVRHDRDVTFVAIKAPSFLASTNLISVTALTAIIAIAAVGEALVIITKNIDLSVESTMGWSRSWSQSR